MINQLKEINHRMIEESFPTFYENEVILTGIPLLKF